MGRIGHCSRSGALLKLCIVLPDGILGNPDDEHIRIWLLKHCEVLALVDMPVELFLPKVGIQTPFVFLRRKSTYEMNQESLSGEPSSYPILWQLLRRLVRTAVGTACTSATVMDACWSTSGVSMEPIITISAETQRSSILNPTSTNMVAWQM